MTPTLGNFSTRIELALTDTSQGAPSDDDATWARVAAAFAHSAPPPMPVSVNGTAASAAWRPNDVPVTATADSPQGAAASSQLGSTASAGADPGSLSLKFSTPEFGEMSLKVERSLTGTRVELSVEQLNAFQRLQGELQNLGNVLRAAGLNIASLQVVQKAGTALAQQANGRRNIALVGQPQAHSSNPERRRVKVIG